MKRFTKIAIVTMMTGALLSAQPVFAQNQMPIMISEENIEKKDESKFMKFSGVISEIKKDGDTVTVAVDNPVSSLQMIFRVTDEVLLFNSATTENFKVDELKKGFKVEGYYDKNKPMILIYPATVTPDLLIVSEPEAMEQVKIGKFDQNLVSLDHELKLHIGENTVLVNENGENIEADDLTNKELVVFYTISTKSIPAQTTPTKVIALNESNVAAMDEVMSIINEDYYMNNGMKMIPVRKVAELLGYEVNWEQETTSIAIQKQNQLISIKINDKDYTYNGSAQMFELAPEIKDDVSYVPETIIEVLFE